MGYSALVLIVFSWRFRRCIQIGSGIAFTQKFCRAGLVCKSYMQAWLVKFEAMNFAE